MARTDINKANLAGFVEQVKTDAGLNRLVDYKVEFGPIFEEYLRENQWVQFTDLVFGKDQERDVYKINYKTIRDGKGDFNPASKLAGATVIPEISRISMTDAKEHAATWYATDWEKSNGLQNVGNMIIASIYHAADSDIDQIFGTAWASAADANTVVPAVSLADTTINGDNGKVVYEQILQLLMDMRLSGEDNDYVEGKVIKGENLQIAISPLIEELLLAYRMQYPTEAGIMEAGFWGSTFRNVKTVVIDEWDETGYEVIIGTKRAIAGVLDPSKHSKYVPEAVNQDSYMDEYNNVFEYGTKLVFENEVTGVKGTAAAPEKA